MLIDTHCHLDFPVFSNKPFVTRQDKEVTKKNAVIPLAEALHNMYAHRVSTAICISVNLEDWSRVYALASTHSQLYCTVGVHPEYSHAPNPSFEELFDCAKREKVVAIGECGLDYYHFPESPLWQEQRFITHINVARASKKPLVIHSRDCGVRMLEILTEQKAGPRDGGPGGVMHCFTDTWEIASQLLDLGFYISFSGIVTFKNAHSLQEVARRVPPDRFVIETDAPYLAPHPHRGKTNQPAYVSYVAEHLAQLRKVTFEEIALQSTENAKKLFQIEVPILS